MRKIYGERLVAMSTLPGLRFHTNGTGTFKRVDEVLKMFKSYKTPMGAIVTVTKHNVNALRDMLRYLLPHEVKSALFNPVSPSVPNAYKLTPSIEALITSYRYLLYDLMNMNQLESRLTIKNIESLIIALITTNMRVLACDASPCGAARLLLVVTSEGDVFPCSEFITFPEFRLGNILKHSIEDLLMRGPAIKLRSRRVEEITDCCSCPYGLICGANCPASVYSLHRDLKKPSYYCKFKMALLDEILYIIYQKGIENILRTFVSERVKSMLESSAKAYEVSRYD